MSCTERDFTCGVRPGTETVVTQTRVAEAACPGISVQLGTHRLEQSPGGCVTVTRTDFSIPDGVYTNATVTITNGYISGIATGAPVLQAVTPLCTTSETDSGGTDGAGTVGIDPSPCNLSAFAGGQLSTFVFAEGSNGVSVSGCGTAADPIVIEGPDIPAATPVTGVTLADTYGFHLANGLVKAWAAPVMNLTTAANSGITLVADPVAHTFDIALTPVTTTTTTTTSYAEPVGVSFAANTFAPTTSGTLWVYGRPDTTYLLEWKAASMEGGGTYGTTSTYSVTTDSNGLYSAAYTNAPKAGLYSVQRNIGGTNTVVAYVQV